MLLHILRASFFVIVCTTLYSTPALASDTSIQIKEAVNRFLIEYEESLLLESNSQQTNSHKRIATMVGYVDSRLNLKPCESPLEVTLRNSNRTSGRLTTKVSCSTGSLWSLYVPITIDIYQTVIVAHTPIPRGSSLQAHHLTLKEKNISTLYRGYYPNIKPLLGYITTRAIRADEVISPRNLTSPKVVYRNEEVVIIAKAGGLKVRATGIALSDGVLGERISIRNKITKKVIEARVKGPGRVEIQI